MFRQRFIPILILLAVFLSAVLVFPGPVNFGLGVVEQKIGRQLFSVPERPFQLGLDLQGGVHLVYQADLTSIVGSERSEAMSGLRDVIERRVNLFGVTEPLVQTEGTGEVKRLIVELAGITSPEEAIRIIGETPYLEFRKPKDNYEELLDLNRQAVEAGQVPQNEIFEPTQLSGRFLSKAQLGFDNLSQEPLIELEFNDEGAVLFRELTEQNIGRPIAIFLDGFLLQAPTVREAILGGRAQITGGFTAEEGRQLARELNAGALPVPIELVSQQAIGPTLGRASLDLSVRAGIIGTILVIAFMLLFYRLPGLLASLSLAVYIVVLLALFKLIPVTLTLAGIGGVILSVGMAVDANILIFSRMREEMREGRELHLALSEGFRRAWPSIRDGNLTTLLVALILFWFGTSFVQGFALTLSLGIVLSMVSSMVLTRMLMEGVGVLTRRAEWMWK
ncbi:MAG: protein translocase subunit SecD [bacterium]|nr:protein translocase subunit SecD [bacterium]